MIQISNLNKSYAETNGRLEVLKGIELNVEKGTMIVIMGVSGAGKSTLLNILGGLDVPDSGSIHYNDVDLSSLQGDSLARFRNASIGFVFQFHHLLPEFDLVENVIMPGLIAGKRKEALLPRGRELLGKVGLLERASHRPGELSGGECQRAAVARALFNEPAVVLADEPSGNLDRGNSERLHQLIRDLCNTRQYTFLVATHNEHLARLADRILYLSDGMLKEKP